MRRKQKKRVLILPEHEKRLRELAHVPISDATRARMIKEEFHLPEGHSPQTITTFYNTRKIEQMPAARRRQGIVHKRKGIVNIKNKPTSVTDIPFETLAPQLSEYALNQIAAEVIRRAIKTPELESKVRELENKLAGTQAILKKTQEELKKCRDGSLATMVFQHGAQVTHGD